MRQANIDDTVQKYLGRLKVEHVGELAQYLIALKISLSPQLAQKLIDLKQVAYAVGCYLSPDVQDVVRAVEFLCQDGSDEAVQILTHSDLNQVVYLLQQSQISIQLLSEEKRKLESQRDAIKSTMANGNQPWQRNFRAELGGGRAGLAGFSEAMLG